ncbi:MAG: hybrid sensor histidine kinase/response regulator [Chloroflexia bacterium]|nr:hybrid sensor histidine kinase/response regulator [Chloroflexia bacterium]
MTLDDDILQQLMVSFRQELAERLGTINSGLLALEQQPEPPRQAEILEELFRHVHSLKGAARAVQLKPIEELAHGMEDVFGAAKRGSIHLDAEIFDLLYQGLDLIGIVMARVEKAEDLEQGLELPDYLIRLGEAWRRQPVQVPQLAAEERPAPREAPAKQSPPSAVLEGPLQSWSGETIRVPTARLDELMAQSGELLVTRLALSRRAEEIAELLQRVGQWQRDWQRLRGGNGAQGELAELLQRNELHLRELAGWIGGFSQRLGEDLAKLMLVTEGLQEGVKQARMLPLATLVGTLRRIVRDLAREKGVEVAMEVVGGDVEMDKYVLEQLQDPLMHLLRNCIDHGIEPPDEREQRGKARRGRIELKAERQGNSIQVEIWDDGAGVDPQAVREAAVRRGLLSAEAAAEIGQEEILSLIFAPELSTSPIITEVSGRGIGLDIVRRNVEGLQGRVEVESRPGEWTRFRLTLPLTLVSTRCLLLREGGAVYAVPIGTVERIEVVTLQDMAVVEGRLALQYRGRPLPLARLDEILELGGEALEYGAEEEVVVLVLTAAGDQVGFVVEEVLDETEVVVKNLGRQLARVRNVAGATVLGTGRVALILNVGDLIKSAQRAPSRTLLDLEVEREEREEKRKRILIVDDSITTRTLEKNILTTAGYEVLLATDGQEALDVLAEYDFDLIVADVDMPRMDGFDLTESVKQEPRYQDLPVILVTSLDSPEYKARGIEVGAEAYIVKGAFDQDALLETIQQLI